MKTTVEIPDDLLRQAKQLAGDDQTTLRQLLIQGLRMILASRAEQPRFELPDCSFGGEGVHPDVREGSWTLPFDASYEGRGS